MAIQTYTIFANTEYHREITEPRFLKEFTLKSRKFHIQNYLSLLKKYPNKDYYSQ